MASFVAGVGGTEGVGLVGVGAGVGVVGVGAGVGVGVGVVGVGVGPGLKDSRVTSGCASLVVNFRGCFMSGASSHPAEGPVMGGLHPAV